MVLVFNTRTVKDMEESVRQTIIDAGVPIEVYTTGIVDLGARNRKALGQFANLATKISFEELPIPPSRFIELVVDITTGKSKRDYRIMLDGKPGDGKSYSCFSLACRYAMEIADRNHKEPTDYFSLDNCALLQDSEGVTALMDRLGKYQAVIIDDAGVSASSQNWNTPEVKAIGQIMQTCRTKRWFLIYNAPNRKMVSNQVRDLVYAKGSVYKPCHDADLNIIKINSTYINSDDPRNKEWKHRFSFDDKKLDYYAVYNPDMFDPYAGMIDKYDKLRDSAGDSIIHDKAVQQHDLKNPQNSRSARWQEALDKHYPFVKGELQKVTNINAVNRSAIRRVTGLSDREVIKMMAKYMQEKNA